MAATSKPVMMRRRIRVRGIVQGVGFRPFVYNLAQRLALRGFVLNSSSGVTIEIEGPELALDEFLQLLHRNAPPLARIEEMTVAETEPLGDTAFIIRHSLSEPGEFALVSPDVATCDDCWRDVTDKSNRRYAYPFTNCTNCGPRYTIIRDIPYDRPMTTMAGFRMCPECEAEYHDATNRRFHAQPNACPACGPGLALARAGSVLPETFDSRNALAVLKRVRELLHGGSIVAIRGVGGFHLACDAENDEAVRLLRARKKRSDKPFALMARDLAAVERFSYVSGDDGHLLLSPERAITILRRRPGTKLSADIAPGNETVGVMLPYTPLHLFLFGDGLGQLPELTALVLTSGNLSDEPIVTANEDAWQRLSKVADWFLMHNRDIYMRVDDSVARDVGGRPRVLRRSRGFAPHPIDVGRPVRELLACGAELKNTFCVTKGRCAVLSQHIGDLDNYEARRFFQETLANVKKLFRVDPKAIAYDLHPGYASTRFALAQPLPQVGVQHHHAHVASCMAEHHLTGKVIGVAFDGTGYGTDGQIWGGEFLVADYAGFERRAHFRYVPLPGGDAAVKQTWRPAVSWLRETFGTELPRDLNLLQRVPEKHVALVARMMERNLNTVLTSSCGRLFDAVASLIGIRDHVTFEGQAAIELEMATRPGVPESYPFEIASGECMEIDMRATIAAIVDELRRSEATQTIASRFHNTIARVIADICARIRAASGLNRVCMSGGTFQNVYLLEHTTALLREERFEVFTHSSVPPNDGGLALGQAVIANEILQHGA